MERLRDPACHMVGRDTLNPIGNRPASPEVYSVGRNKHRVSVISIACHSDIDPFLFGSTLRSSLFTNLGSLILAIFSSLSLTYTSPSLLPHF